MKKIIVAFLITFTLTNCNSFKKVIAPIIVKNSIPKLKTDFILEYIANTRGFYRKITIQNQVALVSMDRNAIEIPKTIKISDADWEELVAAFQILNLEALPDLKAPTEKRFYDGAAIANLSVTFNDKLFQSNGFDHGFPPNEIKKIVVKMNTFDK